MSYPPPPSGGNEPPADGGQGGYGPPPGGGQGGGYGPPPHGGQGGYGSPGDGGGYGPPPGDGYGGYGQQPTGDSQKALWAMISGIVGVTVGLCFCGPINIVPIVLAILARKDIAASGGTLGGSGKATAGLILGIIGLVGWAIFVVIAAMTGSFNFSTYNNF